MNCKGCDNCYEELLSLGLYEYYATVWYMKPVKIDPGCFQLLVIQRNSNPWSCCFGDLIYMSSPFLLTVLTNVLLWFSRKILC